jgi:pimeloyl-ACP methyl ester carboxylesterase
VGAAPPTPEAQERRRRLIALLEQGDLKTVSEQMTATSFSPGLKERDPEKFEAYKSIKLKNDPKAFARLWSALAAASPPDLSRVACPVLVIAGTKDAFTPLETARATAAAIPNSRLEVLPAGHAAAIETPEEFNRTVLDFLSGLP